MSWRSEDSLLSWHLSTWMSGAFKFPHVSFILFCRYFGFFLLQLPTYRVRWHHLHSEISVLSSSKTPNQPLMRPEVAAELCVHLLSGTARVMFDLNAAGLRSGVHQDSSHIATARTGRSSQVFLGSDGSGKVSTPLGKKGDGWAACDVVPHNTVTTPSPKVLLNWGFLFCMSHKGGWNELGTGW